MPTALLNASLLGTDPRWSDFVSFMASGISRGAIVALAALGFLLTFKATGVVNFAQGSLISMGAYAAIWFNDPARGFPIVLAYVAAIVFMFLVGVTIERVAYAPLRGRSVHVIVIATLGASIIIDTVLNIVFGATPKSLRTPADGKFTLFGAVIPHQRVLVLVVTLIVVGFMSWGFNKTQFGRQLRAVAADRETAQLYGVRVNLLSMIAFGLAASLAGLAGVLIAPLGTLDPTLGFTVMLGGFSAAILGGFGSLKGVVIGGFIIGFVEYVFGSYNYFDFHVRDYQAIYPFLLMLLVISIKPQGLFTRGEAHGRL